LCLGNIQFVPHNDDIRISGVLNCSFVTLYFYVEFLKFHMPEGFMLDSH